MEAPLRILLVEDNEHDRVAFRRAFQVGHVPCEVTECVRADDALKRLEPDPSSFDLVVIDHELPGQSGLELCKELLDKQLPLPMVLLTGRGSEQLAVDALKSGVNDYLIKDPSQSYLDLLPVVLPDVVMNYGHRAARREAEDALRESEERFRRTVHGSEAGYLFVDLEGRIKYVNEAWLRIHGYASRNNVVGEHFTVTFLDQDKERAKQDFEKILSGQPIPAGEAKRSCKDGSVGYHTFSANPVLKSGKIIGVEAFLIDITERKRAEEELRKINEELRNFAHIVSHDLKTPIVFIQGYSSLLLENYHEKLGEKGQTCLERIKASAHRMELLISDLLALSRLGRVVATFRDVSLLDIVNNVVSDLQDRLKASRVEVVVADDLPVIHCDGERLYQVFDNLIGNAIKFQRSTENPKIEVGYEQKGEYHQFYVKDNGIGIDPKYHHKIFERFYRLKETEDEEGTGLGLAIIERIVNNHGGRVWVESNRGEGAAFYFTIPLEL
jgi:two-component system CheB/CheR fusion protein